MPPSPPIPAIRRQYEAWPYPKVPLLATLPSTHPWELHCSWLWDRCGSGPAPARPRIWLAGCGTFQPYVFRVANPRAEIHATDISEPSLAIARRRCALHGQRHVQFAPVDLADESTWPAGEFDLIECYGVLMNLPDPAATLCALGRRLSANGVLRVMVYPHFSRTRIFQLQRLAKLLGFHAGDRSHPRRFRSLVRALPRPHPLRHAFTTYADSRNDAGVVDAFLHAGDRGFTGWQLGELIESAGLAPALWFHRPWAQPAVMAGRLQLADRSQSFVLSYLDLWQELRGNFVVCLRRAGAPVAAARAEAPHPLFAGTGSVRHALRLSRLRLLGGRVPTRTGDGRVVLRPAQAKALARGLTGASTSTVDALRAAGLLLGTGAPGATLPAHTPFAAQAGLLQPRLSVGTRAPNPFYAHLFAAWELDRRHPELGLPDLETQMARWGPWADPLEERPIHWGLTPFRTCARFRVNVTEHLQRDALPVVNGWDELRLRGDAAALRAAREFARQSHAPAVLMPDAGLRELWSLVFSSGQLFVTTH